jgi:ankyrin repeat protein
VVRGHRGVVELLLARPDVDTAGQDDSGCTPLMWAARFGHLPVVEALLNRRDVDVDARYGRETPL